MAEKLLYLLNRHALVDCHCSQRPAKLMRMHLLEVQLTANFAEADFDAADLQPSIRLQQRDEKSLTGVRALRKVSLKMDFGPSIEVHLALFVSLAENNTFPVFKVHITAIELYKFTDTDAS